ncbi:MAG: DUF1343 domain-containing protein [Abitibacteriaceae bacterium]|nr:DUF1343 domain-containing protein [Abditibacteriaceae bacterium]MBV9866923.1 DUF1343 domain-containing protein [Abditibacteriaceae bacterium]
MMRQFTAALSGLFLLLLSLGHPAPAQVTDSPVIANSDTVLTGLDVLVQSNFAPLLGRHIGLVTNQTGITHDSRSAIDVFAHAPGLKLVALFGPEHGVRGTAAAGQNVKNGRDAKTGLPIYSLYGGTRKPTTAMLRGIDTLVFDMQDIGSRSYTYIATMGQCMEVCAARHIAFVVLDRPNPIGGNRVEGNITEPGFRSFVSPYPIPYCHGLTVGELARMINGRGYLPGHAHCTLTVVPMQGYRRTMRPEETGLPWVPTSPHIPYPSSPYFYAATGIVGELSALSVGIGTRVPFALAGAPGLNANAFASELNRRGLRGVTFKPVQWQPDHGIYTRQICTGVQIVLTDPNRAELSRLNFELMDATRRIAPSLVFFNGSKEHTRMFDLSCGTSQVRRLFLAGKSSGQIWATWNAGSARFRELRKPYLLY